MYKDSAGKNVLEIDARLGAITRVNRELEVTEAQFFNAIKAYRLSDSLLQFANISKNIFDNIYPADWHRMGRGGVQHPSGVFLTQFSVEYLVSAMILSGSNDWKKETLNLKDNILGLFNIYQNGLIQPIPSNTGLLNFLIPMYFQQFVSQADPKSLCTRQWYIFYKLNSKFEDKSFENLNQVFKTDTSLSIQEYTKLCFIIFAYSSASPRFNIGELDETNSTNFGDVFNKEKVGAFLKLVSTDYEGFRKLDKELNGELDPKYTKTRFNPLWIKPIVKLNENDFLAPSITAYITSTFKGLFWWFDAHFRRQSLKKVNEFRSYFGFLFEEYVGDVLKDVYSNENVKSQISYGTKKNNGLFFDWIVEAKEKIFLFEVKSYQFPLEVLQKGNPEQIENEVLNKIIKTIIQMYKRVGDIEKFEELKQFRGKNLVPIAVFYDIPLISTALYKDNILRVLDKLEIKHPNIKAFKYYFISIEELENYCFASKRVDIDYLLEEANKNARTGFMAELSKVCEDGDYERNSILDRSFDEYCVEVGAQNDSNL